MTSTPEVDAYFTGRGQLIIDCPYCATTHRHGSVTQGKVHRKGDGDGSRAPHCDPRYTSAKPDYCIREVGFVSSSGMLIRYSDTPFGAAPNSSWKIHETNKAHALYRFYDSGGQLLYIGISANPGARWKQHRADKPWWTEVASITLEHHKSRSAVLEAERGAISVEKPRYNVVHNRSTTKTSEKIAHPPWGSRAIDMPDTCFDCRDDYYKRGGENYQEGGSEAYLPYQWRAGKAEYSCQHGHQWHCAWGHRRSGEAPENFRHKYSWDELDNTARGVAA